MKTRNAVVEIMERVMLAMPRSRLRKILGEKLKEVVRTIEQLDTSRAKLAKHNLKDLVRLYDVSKFCLLYDADLTILIRDMTCRTNWWESRLYGRLLAMTMLECSEDIPQVLGKDFRASLTSIALHVDKKQQLLEFSRGLSNFRKKYEVELRNIRTISAAHRDHNPDAVLKVIEELDVKALTSMANELITELGNFASAATQVLINLNVVEEYIRNQKHEARQPS